ncbi:hypothetical protein GEW_05264 [Pasteurella multocida subsp. gallicida str. Anand1_poultry]|nr:hypothetical protein AAUPMG_05154 [Pasteurella multocida subsp. multocida str. Anand1_goat]EGP05891.1 hypothetical protein GEW_05264 [Pasteurella multocida subsp. gallicida str. Anand1_poultry]
MTKFPSLMVQTDVMIWCLLMKNGVLAEILVEEQLELGLIKK